MGFDTKKYLKKMRQFWHKFSDQQTLYKVHRRKDGTVIGIKPTPELNYLNLPSGYGRVRRSEFCSVYGDALEFPRFSFTLVPADCTICGIRIDKESEDHRPHVNPDPRLEAKYGKHRLHYPEDISLNIEHFCLLYFLVLALWYRENGAYPLNQSDSLELNELIGKFRKQVEK